MGLMHYSIFIFVVARSIDSLVRLSDSDGNLLLLKGGSLCPKVSNDQAHIFKWFSLRYNTAICSCCKVLRIIWRSGVVATGGWLEVGGCVEILVAEHPTGDIVLKLLYLFEDIFQNSVRGPMSNQYHLEIRYLVKTHGHGCAS